MQRIEPGAVVGARFEILRVAGSGGMGVVYQARDLENDAIVALKTLRRSDVSSAGRFAREIEVLSAISHPRIVGYVSHGSLDGGEPYVVMPWLEGADLEARLQAGALTVDETLIIARGAAEALAHLHQRGLIHRDLKPGNLFLPGGDPARVQVIDLGFTREGGLSAGVDSGELVGTANFIAPEQVRGDLEITSAADVFALGCVLFECLTGRRLFTGAHLMSILAKVLLEEAPRVSELRPEVPAFLDDLVDRMVAKEPKQRPASGAELAAWLSRADGSLVRPREAITSDERRFVTIVAMAFQSPAADSMASAKDFGLDVHLLAERVAVVTARERLGAADQAFLLARYARYVAETNALARVVMTTGSTTAGARLPVGEAIDRAIGVVRTPQAARGVAVDDATAALIGARFHVDGGRIIEERTILDPTRRLLGRPTSCVGRERELAILDATFAEVATGGEPRVLLVTADAGAGKSRLQHEFERRLRVGSPDAGLLTSRGDPFRSSVPYAMVAEVVRRAVGIEDADVGSGARERVRAHVADHVPPADVARVADFIGELTGVRFDEEGRLPLRAARKDPVAMADQIGRAFEELARGWCTKKPMILVFEDLHWSHDSDVKLLDRALGRLAGTRLLVLALARPEIHGRFPALFGKRNLTELQLPPLAKRAAATLVHEVLGEIPAEEVDRLIERSEGNAFYLEELIRAEAARRADGGQVPAAELPHAVLAVAQARLERLDPMVRRALRAASIFGPTFWSEGVSALVGEKAASVGGILQALEEQEAIVPVERTRLTGAVEYAFRHALLQQTAYATLTDEDRVLGHRLAAAWLRDALEDEEVVARHWLLGGERGPAAAAFRSAAELRARRAQPDAAARAAARALLLVDARSAGALAQMCITLLADALVIARRLDVAEVVAIMDGGIPSLGAQAPREWLLSVLEPACGVPLHARGSPPRSLRRLGRWGHSVPLLPSKRFSRRRHRAPTVTKRSFGTSTMRVRA
jgi:hypothetical protein